MQGELLSFPFNINNRCKDTATTVLCGTINAGATVDIDSQTSAAVFGYSYLLQLKTADETKVKTLSIAVQNQNGTIRDQVFSKIGSLSAIIGAVDTAGIYSLQITNNESQAVDYCLSRQKI